jgi:hypothetical protein
MLKCLISANARNLPAGKQQVPFNRASIMKTAWQLYRRSTPAGRPMNRALFAKCLKAGWDLAKRPGSGGMFETYAAVFRSEVAAQSEKPTARINININAIGRRPSKQRPPVYFNRTGASRGTWGIGW